MNRNLIAFTKVFYSKGIFTIFFLCILVPVFGQPGNEKGLPFVKNYSPQLYDGLNTNWSVIQGNDGLMYFGNPTAGSDILQYDGVHWIKISALGKGLINRCFKKDANGIIYYGGSNNFGYLGPDSLGKTAEFSLSKYVPKNKQDFTDVWSIQVAGKDIYFQTRERLFRLTKSGNKWITKTWDPVTHFMYSFYLDGVLYIHQQGKGLFKMINDSLVLIPNSEFLGKERMQVMLPYNESNDSASHQYLIATFTRGLYIFDGKSFKAFPSPIDSLIKNTLVYRGIQINGNYALSILGRGVVIIDPQGKIKQIINKNTGLASDIVYDFVTGKRGALWLATDNGISKVDINSPFTTFNSQSGISAAPLSMARLPDGSLYVGSNNGLLRYNPAADNFQMVNQVPRDQIFTVIADGNTLLIPAAGLYMVKDGKVALVQPSVNDSLKLSHLFISKKYPDLLYGATTFGLTLFVRDHSKATGWKYLGYFPKTPPNIFGIAEDENGRTWAGSQTGEAIRVTPFFDKNGQPDVSKSKVETFGKEQGLTGFYSRIFSINHQIYFLTDSSTMIYNEAKKHFETASVLGKHFFSGREDSKGKITLAAFKSLNSVSSLLIATPESAGKYRIDSTSLMPIMNMVGGGDYYDIHDNNIVWFLADDQLIRYDSKIKVNADQPYKTIISGITSRKNSLNPLEGTENKPVEIKFKNNSLRFDYATPFYENEDKTQYQTWLEGFEKGYSDWDKNTYKEYTNLSAGKYTFHVRAKNIYGKISEAAVFPLTVLPAWYATWWAYLLYALVGIFLIYLFIKYRTRQLEEKHRELEKTIKERTSQLSARVEELAVINSVQEGLAAKLDINAIYELVGEKIRQIFNAQMIFISTYDKKTNLVEDKYAYEKGDRTIIPAMKPIGFSQKVIETQKPVLVNKDIEAKSKEVGSVVVSGELAKSLVIVPMIKSGEVTGLISLQNMDHENAFSDSDVHLLGTLANSMSVALENARLFDETTRLLKETEQRNTELAIINGVQEGLVAQMNMEGIYTLVGNRIRDLFDAQSVVIRSFDYKSGAEIFNYAIEKGERLVIDPRPMDNFSQHLIEIKKPEIINQDFEKYIRLFSEEANLEGEIPKSAVFVPLVLGEKVTGNVSLQNVDHENAFTESDVSLLTTLANSMSVALENARLFDETTRLLKETEQRTSELAVINSVQEGLVAQMEMQSIYDLVGEKIRNIFSAQIIDIATYDKNKNIIEDRYSFEKGDRSLLGAREPSGFRKHIIETQQPLVINEDMEGKSKEYESYVSIGEQPKSAIFVPMITSGEVTGIISLQNLDHENAFSSSDLNLLVTLANSMSVALKSARLFDETSRLLKETKQRTAELGVINSVQEGLVAQLDIQSIYDLVGEKIREIFNAQIIDIVTYNKNKNEIEDRYAYEKGDRTLLGAREPLGFRKHIIETQQVMVINQDMEKHSKEFESYVTIGEQPKSAVFVPMISNGEINGIISLQNLDHEQAFSPADVNLLVTLANSMSVALKSANLFDETNRLLKETEQRNAELAVINSVQEGLVAQLDINSIYDLVGEKIREIFNAQVIDIVTYDPQRNIIEDQYAYEKGDRTLLGPREPKGFRKYVINTGEMLLHNENVGRAMNEFGNKILIGEVPKSQIYVPLISSGKVKGIISLQNLDHEHAFSESDVNLLKTLANSMSVALESARLFNETNRLLKETEQRNAELAVINSVQESLVAQMDMHAIYLLVGEKVREVFNAQVIDITTFDHKTGFIEDKYAYEKGDRTMLGRRKPSGFRKYVIESGQMLVINKGMEKERPKYDNSVVYGQAAKSMVMAPLMSGGKVNGVISLQNLDHEDAFSESDVSLLSTLVNSMSVALKSARLFDETNRLLKETEQRTAELAVINSVQEGLANELDMQAIYNLVGDRIQKLFDAQVLIIASFDLEKKTENFNYAIENGEKIKVGSRPLNHLRELLINEKHTIHIETEKQAKDKYHLEAIGGTKMPKSLLFVPLLSGNEVKGYVSIQNVDAEYAFTDSNVRLLETLANSMSVALENARLFDETNRLLKETEQRTSELAVINNVQDGLVREMNVQAIYNLVGNRLCDLFPDTQTLVIRTFDHASGLEYWHYAIEKGVHLTSEPRPLIWANKEMIKTRKPIQINENYQEVAKKYGSSGVTTGKPPKSAVFVPMIVGDLVKGSVSLQNVDKENAFNESDMRLLTTLTNSMSVALENARLFDETTHLLADAKQRASELSTVNNISKALTSQLNPNELIQFVGEQLRDLFKANIVYLALLNKRTKMIDFPYQYGDDMAPLQFGEGLTSKIISTGESLLINKDVTLKTQEFNLAHIGIPASSYLGVPIPVGDEIIGVLSIQSTEQQNRFNQNDERLLNTIASSVGVALTNAQLFEDVEKAKMEAEKASKVAEKANEAKSAFLSTVSHELRTPLTSVLGFAKIINKRLNDKIFPVVDHQDAKIEKTINQVNENLQVVISEGERLTHLINDVLDLAKIEAGRMEWNQENVSLAEVAERAILATTSLFDQKKIELVKKIDNDIPDIIGDPDKLIQVVINLFSNAVKFTEHGAVICKVSQKNNEVIVSVSDTGIGIAKDDYGAVFEQFKQVGGDTLTDKPKGTGLGLPICKEIVEHHSGRIWVESEVGKGSTFSFAIPFIPSENKKVKKQKPIHLDELVKQLKEQVVFSKLKMNGHSATILVVDDDDSIRSLLEQELSEAGYLIEQATNGKQALECIRKNRPDLVILDVMMPEMNGFDVAAILKNDPQTMDIPIIILSIIQDKARGFRIGVDRYLTKPIDTAQLFQEVGNLLEQGKSKRKVMVVDEDSAAVRSLTDVLQTKGYQVVESDGKELVKNAIDTQPDIIILNSIYSGKQEIVKTLRFEKGLENVLFFIYQ
ncbi:MAG TPA: GAF domain-containing protein [Hanamia sp.]|nr:GAF domain-containing protein [Hanamia sp.]